MTMFEIIIPIEINDKIWSENIDKICFIFKKKK